MWILGGRLGKLGIVALGIYLKSWDWMRRRSKTWLWSTPFFMDTEKYQVLGKSGSIGRNILMTQKPREECFQGIRRQGFTEPIVQIISFWPQCPEYRNKRPSSHQLPFQDNSFFVKANLQPESVISLKNTPRYPSLFPQDVTFHVFEGDTCLYASILWSWFSLQSCYIL